MRMGGRKKAGGWWWTLKLSGSAKADNGRALMEEDKHVRSSKRPERPLVVRFLLELAVAAVVVSHLSPSTPSLMESKKRPHADDGEHSRAKKRAVSDDRASPSHPNGTTTSHGDEPSGGDNIEVPCLQWDVVRA